MSDISIKADFKGNYSTGKGETLFIQVDGSSCERKVNIQLNGNGGVAMAEFDLHDMILFFEKFIETSKISHIQDNE